ncbi:MAG TPA: hypothetical protein VGI64_12425 [Streptosporangiaceae bacterium]
MWHGRLLREAVCARPVPATALLLERAGKMAMSGVLAASAATVPVLADSATNQVSTILHALAPLLWPVVVIIALVLFQAPLRAAIGRVNEVDVGTAKVVLQQQADTAASAVKAAASAVAVTTTTSPPAIESAVGTAASNPSGSVLTAWSAVEDAAGQAHPSGPASVVSQTVPQVLDSMAQAKDVPSSLVRVAQTLESLRGVADSAPKSITPATAVSFVNAARDLVRVLDAKGNGQPSANSSRPSVESTAKT